MSTDVMIEPDERGRVSLSKIPGSNVDRYVGRRLADGSILLQPAVVLTHQALTSLLRLQHVPRDADRVGRTLSDVLASREWPEVSEAAREQALREIERRRAPGERSLADITDDERAALVAGTAGGLTLGQR